MIDYLTFIDELKTIKNANDTIESKKRVGGIIDEHIKKYEGLINEHEKQNAPATESRNEMKDPYQIWLENAKIERQLG
tara:strand:- start:1308 stop:1541 length:234 start_codon:yes stop_codon:yes gene_type:complete